MQLPDWANILLISNSKNIFYANEGSENVHNIFFLSIPFSLPVVVPICKELVFGCSSVDILEDTATGMSFCSVEKVRFVESGRSASAKNKLGSRHDNDRPVF